jgi:hypothetical protein
MRTQNNGANPTWDLRSLASLYTATAGRYVTATVQHASAVIIFNTMIVIVKYYDIIVLLNVRFFFIFYIAKRCNATAL